MIPWKSQRVSMMMQRFFSRSEKIGKGDFVHEYKSDLYLRRGTEEDDYDHDYDHDDDWTSIMSNSESNKNDWTWETFQSHTHILLPPSMEEKDDPPPSHIVHFVGGTFFGSYPLQFYKPMLEQVAKLSNAIVVATSVPVVLNENPLNHYNISQRIRSRFWRAYKYVIQDEYHSDIVKSMKIIGLGHSLGARLILLMSNSFQTTERMNDTKSSLFNPDDNPSPTKRNRTNKTSKAIDYDACIFMAFNNYNALESIPGLDPLGKSIVQNSFSEVERKRERLFKQTQDDLLRQSRFQRKNERSRNRNPYEYVQEEYYDDFQEDGEFRDRDRDRNIPKRRKSRQRLDASKGGRKYYYLDDSEIGLGEVVSAMSVGIAEGIQEIKTAITPDLDRSDFEFQPTPQALWDRVRSGGFVKKTLLVQFDQDKIDQSSKLATICMDFHQKGLIELEESTKMQDGQGSTTNILQEEEESRDILNVSAHPSLRLALLSGTHLTPVTYTDSFLIQAIKRTGVFDAILEEALQEDTEYNRRSKQKRDQTRNEDLTQLSKTISSFICSI